MILQSLMSISGKPMVMLGGLYLNPTALQENISRGIP